VKKVMPKPGPTIYGVLHNALAARARAGWMCRRDTRLQRIAAPGCGVERTVAGGSVLRSPAKYWYTRERCFVAASRNSGTSMCYGPFKRSSISMPLPAPLHFHSITYRISTYNCSLV
jgi:hypothetical protein